VRNKTREKEPVRPPPRPGDDDAAEALKDKKDQSRLDPKFGLGFGDH
jgi:hypothetical protein